jgi:hypothetical protein
MRNLPTSRKTHAFVIEDIDTALKFQIEAQTLGFHSALQIYSSPDTSQAASIFAVVGNSRENVLQKYLLPSS